MLILSQDRRMLEPIESSAGVYADGNEIRIDFLTCCTALMVMYLEFTKMSKEQQKS